MITITEVAKAKIATILEDEDGKFLRIFVQGGGCTGFQYGFALDEVVAEDDIVVLDDSIKVVVDSMSMQYVDNAKIDYRDDIMGAQFVFDNPNVTRSCGCGSSFSVD